MILAPGLVLYVGPGGVAERHAHHAVQLAWVQDGDLELRWVDRRAQRGRAVVVPAGIEHELVTTTNALALLLVDAHGARGRELDARARTLLGKDLGPSFPEMRFPSDLELRAFEDWSRTLLGVLGVTAFDPRAPSRATRRAIAYIERSLDGVPRITEAAAFASMSASRLSHHFSDEIGIPFRRFVLWTRIKRAAETAREGGDLTAAATSAGFSDGAHLSRTFRSMFGLSPSLVLPFVEIVGSPWMPE